MKDKALRKLRVVIPDEEELAKRFLKSDFGWDGKYPIPVSWFGCKDIKELEDIDDLIHLSGDDHCIWVGTAATAYALCNKGYSIIVEKLVLAKRKTFWTKKSRETTNAVSI